MKEREMDEAEKNREIVVSKLVETQSKYDGMATEQGIPHNWMASISIIPNKLGFSIVLLSQVANLSHHFEINECHVYMVHVATLKRKHIDLV